MKFLKAGISENIHDNQHEEVMESFLQSDQGCARQLVREYEALFMARRQFVVTIGSSWRLVLAIDKHQLLRTCSMMPVEFVREATDVAVEDGDEEEDQTTAEDGSC